MDAQRPPLRPTRTASGGGAARRVLYVVGARPNFVKMAPVVREMRRRAPWIEHIVVHTGQHYDVEMCDIFFDELGLPKPDRLLGVGSGTHGVQTARALERLEAVLEELRPDAVVVPGDVNSTLAAALAAAKLGIRIAHLEAGLRSFDRSMPEEINRVLVDQLARWCFTHSPEAEGHLNREGIGSDRVRFVGNTMIDTLVRLRPRISESEIHLNARRRTKRLPPGDAASPSAGGWSFACAGDRRAVESRLSAAGRFPGAPSHSRAAAGSGADPTGPRAR